MATSSASLQLDPERISEVLPKEIRARLDPIEVVDEVASTNDILYDDTIARDRVLVARRQTGGRGRQGRSWETVDGALCFSVLHAFPAEAPPALALWIGIALIKRLREMELGQPCLNWPNDLMYGSAKFGGILTECRVRGGQTRCVVGVGVNVEDAPELDRQTTSIARACGQSPDPNRLAAGLIESIVTCLVRLDSSAPGKLMAHFEPYDGLRGSEVHVTGSNQAYTGRAQGVDDRGCLLVEGEEGVRQFDSADVRLRQP